MDCTAYPHLELDRVPLTPSEQYVVTQLEHLSTTGLAVCPHTCGTRTLDLICIALAQHFGAAAQVRIGSPVPLTSWWLQRGNSSGIIAEVMPTHRRSPFWLPTQTHPFAAVVYDMRDAPGRRTTVAAAIRRLFIAYGRTPFILLLDDSHGEAQVRLCMQQRSTHTAS